MLEKRTDRRDQYVIDTCWFSCEETRSVINRIRETKEMWGSDWEREGWMDFLRTTERRYNKYSNVTQKFEVGADSIMSLVYYDAS